MWIELKDTSGLQVFVNWECVTHIETGNDFYGDPCVILNFSGGEFVKTHTKIEEFTSLLERIMTIGGPTNEN